ncbi:MAG: peptidoglycan-binding domain-containing protein [Candidatus Paceibacterota bacterium]
MSIGTVGQDVYALQKILNSDTTTALTSSGIGSSGMETQYFGQLTKNAVIEFQEKYTSEILTPNGLTRGTGFVGVSTRAKLNSLVNTVSSSTNTNSSNSSLTQWGNYIGGSSYTINNTNSSANPSGQNLQNSSLPYVNLTVNNSHSPSAIASGSSVIVSWTSGNVTSCTSGLGVSFDTNGTKTIDNITVPTSFTLTCTGLTGVVADSVHVSIIGQADTSVNLTPSVDVKINNSDVDFVLGQISTTPNDTNTIAITWSAHNVSDCVASSTPGSITGWSGTDISSPAGGTYMQLDQPTSIGLVCKDANGNNVSDFAKIVSSGTDTTSDAYLNSLGQKPESCKYTQAYVFTGKDMDISFSKSFKFEAYSDFCGPEGGKLFFANDGHTFEIFNYKGKFGFKLGDGVEFTNPIYKGDVQNGYAIGTASVTGYHKWTVDYNYSTKRVQVLKDDVVVGDWGVKANANATTIGKVYLPEWSNGLLSFPNTTDCQAISQSSLLTAQSSVQAILLTNGTSTASTTGQMPSVISAGKDANGCDLYSMSGATANVGDSGIAKEEIKDIETEKGGFGGWMTVGAIVGAIVVMIICPTCYLFVVAAGAVAGGGVGAIADHNGM